MPTIATLLTPISDASPAGSEARSSDAYEVVASEMEKLTSLSATAPIDWALVEKQGSELLATQSKDFMLAAWVSAAWVERHGIDGLLAGIELHAHYIEHYWETGFPPLKRIRGRRNALTWWVERSTAWLSNQTLPPLEPQTWTALVEAAEKIDRTLSDKDPEGPVLSSFVRQLKSLDVIEQAAVPEAADEPAPAPMSEQGQAVQPNANPVAREPSTASVAPPAPSQTASISIPTLPVTPQNLASIDDIINALGPVNQALGQLGAALMAVDRFNPLAIEMNRFAARSTLIQSPPDQQGATALMPPPVAIMDAYQIVCGTGNADGIIEFCESRLPTFPFWLDLDYQSARGFAMLEARGAPMRQAIIKNVLAFLERLPGIEHLTFSDGTPFASNETQQWLDECRAQQAGNAGGDGADNAFDRAKEIAQTGKAGEAMSIYHDLSRQTSARRDQFRARIAMAELFISTRGDADPIPYVQALADDCQHYHLADWEPELAAQAWKTILDACRQVIASPTLRDDPTKHARYHQLHEQALQQLATIDFPAAMRYGV